MKQIYIFLLTVFFSTQSPAGPELFKPDEPSKGREFNIQPFPHRSRTTKLRLPFDLVEVERGNSYFVNQGEVTVLGPHNRHLKSIFTVGLCPCVAVIIQNLQNGSALLAHVAHYNDLNSLDSFVAQLGIADLSQVRATLFSHQATAIAGEGAAESQVRRMNEIQKHLLNRFSILGENIREIIYQDYYQNFALGEFETVPTAIGVDRNGNLFHPSTRHFFDLSTFEPGTFSQSQILGLSLEEVAMFNIQTLRNAGALSDDNDFRTYLTYFLTAEYLRQLAQQGVRENGLNPASGAAPLYGRSQNIHPDFTRTTFERNPLAILTIFMLLLSFIGGVS